MLGTAWCMCAVCAHRCIQIHIFYCTRFTANVIIIMMMMIRSANDVEIESWTNGERKIWYAFVYCLWSTNCLFHTMQNCKDATTRASYPFLIEIFKRSVLQFHFASLLYIWLWLCLEHRRSIQLALCCCVVDHFVEPHVLVLDLDLFGYSRQLLFHYRSRRRHLSTGSNYKKSSTEFVFFFFSSSSIFTNYRDFFVMRARSLTCQLARGNVLLI